MAPPPPAFREALLLGLAGGMRTFAPLVALTRRGLFAGSPAGRRAVLALTVTELAADKHPKMVSRLEPPGLAGRFLFSAVAGNRAAGPPGALAGAAAAGLSAFGCSRLRGRLGRRTGLPDPVIAVGEDLLAYGLVFAATRRPEADD